MNTRTFTIFPTHGSEPSGQLLRRNLSDSAIQRHALENNGGGVRTERVKSRDPFTEFEQIWHTALYSLKENTSPSICISCSLSIIYLFIYPYIFLRICLFIIIYLIADLFIYLPVYFSTSIFVIYFYLIVSLFIC